MGIKGATTCTWFAGMAAVIACAVAMLAVRCLVTGSEPWFIPLGFALGGAAVGATAVALLAGRFHAIYAPTRRFLDDMARIDARGSLVEPAGLPRLPDGHPLASIAGRLGESYAAIFERLHDLEQSRAAMEVRCRRAEQEAERIRTIFAGLSEPILAIDQYDELVMANPSARELFELGEEQLAQRLLDEIIPCQKLVELLRSTSQRKIAGSRTEEIELADAAGEGRWYRATAVKLADENGADEGGRGAVAVLRDISDRKALQRRNAEFVSSVSHEMKTPLAGIKAYVELLADGDAEDEATREEFLDVINGQTDRMQRLIDNLLNLARIEAGVVQVHKAPRSLNEILEEALRVVRPAAEAKNITLTGELSPLYLGVLADRDMLLQAAINLLSNAVKYTHADGQVTLRSRMIDGEVRFEVQDTGVGLSAEDKDKVFEKFYRVKKDKDMAAGTGLGLPLAKHIVEDVHGGRIAVDSTLGEGSTFAVTLPGAGQRVGDG